MVMHLPFEQQFLFIDESLELLFLGAPVVLLTLNLVASADCLELSVFDFLCLAVEHLDQGRDHIVEAHNLLKEVNGLSLHRLSLAVLLLRQDANLVVLVERDVHIDSSVHLPLNFSF